MQKLLKFVVELILVAILVAWIVIKYPALVDAIIPWIALAIAWHLTWDIGLQSDIAKKWAAVAKRKWGVMVWIVAFFAGGLLSIGYLASIRKGITLLNETINRNDAGPATKEPAIPDSNQQLASELEIQLRPQFDKLTPAEKNALDYIRILQPIGEGPIQDYVTSRGFQWSPAILGTLQQHFVSHDFNGKFYLTVDISLVKKFLDEAKPAEEPTRQNSSPDVALRFIRPQAPVLVIVNPSEVVASQIKWALTLWNMDLPERNDALPIPIQTFEFIRPHQESGPLDIFGSALIAPLLKPGNRLFGSASVDCPSCARGRTYIVSIIWGSGGWFAEVPDEKDGKVLTPRNLLRETREAYFKELDAKVPTNLRISIGGPQISTDVPHSTVPDQSRAYVSSSKGDHGPREIAQGSSESVKTKIIRASSLASSSLSALTGGFLP